VRIVFVGAVDFSRHCFLEVLKDGGDVVAVLTADEERARRHSDAADLSEAARVHEIPCHRIRNINAPETLALLRRLAPDMIFIFGWSQLVSKEVLAIPTKGCIGAHPALLPRNRGRHPLIWALAEGRTEGGLTFFYLDEGADSGDILWQKRFPIALTDDAGALYGKIKALAAEGIREFLPRLKDGTVPRVPQDHSLATYGRKRTERDGEIDWAAPSLSIYNLIRALAHPYPGAHTFLKGGRVLVWRARPPEGTEERADDSAPGTVLSESGGTFDVRTGDGRLTVFDLETPEGSMIQIKIGDRFGRAA
jgi:methionyl-tRNA formyltransferase